MLHKIKNLVRYKIKLWQESAKLKAAIDGKSDLKIIVGSASLSQEGWLSTDYPTLDITNQTTFYSIFKSPGRVSHFLAEHVWEHLPPEIAGVAVQNCYTFLKAGGVLRIAVPDGFHPDPDYIAQVKPGGYGAGADDHKVLYNYITLTKILKDAGFDVVLLEWFDDLGQFNSQAWDIQDGIIRRSQRFDSRNEIEPTKYTSLIIDARKPL